MKVVARRRGSVGVIAIALGLALGAIQPAHANTGRAFDPDDAPGRLDVKSISHGHGHRPGYLRHRISMHEPWQDRLLRDETRRELELLFDLEGDSCYDRTMRIVYENGRFVALLQRWADPFGCPDEWDDTSVGTAYVEIDARFRRPDDSSIVVTFDGAELEENRGSYRWSVMTKYRLDVCPRKRCYDYAPPGSAGRRGILRHELPD